LFDPKLPSVLGLESVHGKDSKPKSI